MPRVLSFIGVPYDGAATLGWPGARYAPDEIRKNLEWMKMRVEEGHLYWIDEDRIVPFPEGSLVDAGDAEVVPHDLMATLEATRLLTAEESGEGRVPIVVGGDDSMLFPAAAGVHDAVEGTVGIVHFDAHLDLMDESETQGTHSQSSGMRRALELERVDPSRSVQVGTRNFNFPTSKRYIDEIGLTEIPARQVLEDGAATTVARVAEVLGDVDDVFVAVDIDVLDPAYAPGVGWQEPGGLTPRLLLDLLIALAPRASGMSLNEVNPLTDHRSQTSILAANLIFQFSVAAVQSR